MECIPMPIPIQNLLEKYDVTRTPRIGERMNVALTNLFPGLDDTSLFAEIAPWNYTHSGYVLQGSAAHPPTPLLGDKITVNASADDVKLIFPMGACDVLQAKVHQIVPLTVTIDESSLVLAHNKSSQDHWMVEQFAGGYGGWSHGLSYLKQFLDVEIKVLAIESHLPHAVNFALAHRYQLVGHADSMPPDFLIDHPHSTIVNCTIQSLPWQRLIRAIQTFLWDISSPCVSWSFAGRRRGLNALEGQALVDSLAQAKFHKPCYLCLEQVTGFPSHEHFDMVCQILEWAGYRVIHQQCYELASVCPVRRCRWLAICHHVSVVPPPMPIARWPKFNNVAAHFDAILCLDEITMKEFEPTVATASLYWDPRYMPGRKTTWTRSDILRFRLPDMSEPLPCFLAAYGSQHTLPTELLQANGMFGHFVRQGTSFRFFTPVEVLLLHSHASTTLILKPAQQGYQSLGNCISVPHALFGLFHVLKAMMLLPEDLTFTTLLLRFLSERLRASRVVVLQDACAWYVGHPCECQDLKLLLQFYMAQLQWRAGDGNNSWPTGFFFHPIQGLLPFAAASVENAISPTQSFRVQFKVMLFLVPGEYGLLTVDGQVTWQQLLALWHFPVTPKDFLVDTHRLDEPIETTAPDANVLLMPALEDAHMPSQCPDVHKTLLVRNEQDLTMYEVAHEHTWRDICTRCLLPDQLYFDSFGQLTPDDVVLPCLEVTTDPVEVPVLPNFGAIFSQCSQVQIQTWVPANTDILVLLCEGSEHAMEAFQQVWMNTATLTWLRSKGRQLSFHQESSTKWRLLFRPCLSVPATPVPFLRNDLFFWYLQMAVKSLMTAEGIQWVMYYRSRQVCRGQQSGSDDVAVILSLLQFFGQLFAEGSPSLFSQDQRLQPGVLLSQCHKEDAHSLFELCWDVPPTVIDTQMTPTPEPTTLGLVDALDLITHVALDVHADDLKQELHAQYRGDSLALTQMQTLWTNVQLDGVCRSLGYAFQLDPPDVLDPDTLRFHVTPLRPLAELSQLRIALFHHLLAGLLRCYPLHDGLPVTFTFQHNTLLQMEVSRDLTKRTVSSLIRHAYRLVDTQGSARVLLGGLLCDAHQTLRQHAETLSMKHLVIQISAPLTLRLSGGGGSKTPTNKQDFAKLVESVTANMLLEYEMHLPTKLTDKMGMAKLHQSLTTEPLDKRHEAFQAVCSQAEVKLPPHGPRRSQVQGKYQKVQDRKQARATLVAEPAHYQLRSGFFRNADGTAAKLLTQFSPHASGILLTTTATAQEWANVFTTLAPDELGLYVLGPPPSCKLAMSTVSAPATHLASGNEVLLNGVLVQFGSKHIVTSAAALSAVEIKDTQVASITVWKTDFESTQWQQIQSSPVRTVMQMLEADGFQGTLHKAWGRAWQKDGTAVSPSQATSLQFHGEFDKSPSFAALLKRNGFSRIYIQPKSAQGRVDDQWRVIWLPGTPLEIETKTAAVSGTAGLVKSRKGYGIRIESGAFATAWRLLKPDLPEPDANNPSLVFRLYPLPHGVDATILKEWARSQFSWSIKPLRPSGAKQWIIAADTVPEGVLTFNGQPLLLQRIPQKSTNAPGLVLAGPKLSSLANATSPVAGMFQQQDNRIQTLEQAVQKLQVSQADAAKQIQTRQQVMEEQFQQHVHHTKQGMDWLNQEQQNIHQTISVAMQKQEERLATAFDELKVLFQRGMKRTPEEDPAAELLRMNE
eukprot:Skav210138  [mRNA]  locus=scaffold1493:174319:179500:- [translate_table: standard]